MKRHDRLDVNVLARQIQKYKVTRLLVRPVIVEKMVANRMPVLSGQLFTGGGLLFPGSMRAFTRIFPDIALHVLYGSTEAEPISHLNVNTLSDADWQAALTGGGLPVGRLSDYISLHLDETE